MDFDVFISYHTKSSLHITEAVCNALENKRIKCWYAPRNIAGNYARSIVEAIGTCKIFLLILNKEASYSEDVLNEINLAVERVRKGENISIIPFHISEEDISLDAKYYLSRIHWVDAINPPMEKRITELVSRISYILNKNIDSNFEMSKDEPNLKSNYPLSTCNFVGRKEELAYLEENLKKYGKVFVQGMGGIGKSELVKAYINTHKEDYDTIIFAVYENSLIDTVIKDEYFKITHFNRKLDENGESEEKEEYFKRKVDMLHELSNERTLVIIDNFDVEDDINLKELLKGPYNMIITTRNDFRKYQLPVMHIEPMTNMQDLLDIFQENYIIRIKEEDSSVIKEIIELIGRHTLTVQLLASVMQDMRIKPQQMYENLKAQGISNEIQGEVMHSMQNYESIYQCLSVLFKISDLTEEEKQVLKYLTVFPISGIEFDDFMDLCEINTGLVINRLIKKSFIIHDYVTDYISLHPLISGIVDKENSLILEEAKTLIHNIVKKYDWNMLSTDKERYYPISLSIYNKFSDFDVSVAYDFTNMTEFLRDFNNFDETEKILLRAVKLFESNKEKYINELVDTYGKLGYLYYVRYITSPIAKEYNLKIIELLKGKEEYRKNYANALKAISLQYIDMNNPEKAKKYIEEAYKILVNSPDITNIQLGSYFLAYAKIYTLLEKYDKALEYADKSYNCLFEYYKTENGDTSSAIKSKGEINIKMGNIKEGIVLLEQSLEIRKKHCFEYNTPVLRVKEPLMEAYMQNGEYEKARDGFEELYNIIKEHFVNSESWLERIKNNMDMCQKKIDTSNQE